MAAGLALSAAFWSPAAIAATIAPPMLDITRLCNETSRHNVTAMSECVVAESEARSVLLQQWNKLPNGNAEKCVKLARKARKQPYTALAKCLSVGPIDASTGPTAAPK